MIIQKDTVLMLTLFFISANAEERSKQDGQLRTTYGVVIVGFTKTKVVSSDDKTQVAGLNVIRLSRKTLK
jgi:hypothetical protein